jgi:hypothetical protein
MRVIFVMSELEISLFFVACPYMGMQLSYSSKFRVALYRRCTGGGKSRDRFVKYDKYRVFQTSIFMYVNTLLCTLFVHGFRRGNGKKILIFRQQFT